MKDLRFEDKNNQKKSYSVFASGVIEAVANDELNHIIFTLPKASVIKSVSVVVIGASVDVIDIKANDVAINTADVDLSVAGYSEATITPKYFETGASVTVNSAALTAPTAFKVIVEYIETELTDGTYTD